MREQHSDYRRFNSNSDETGSCVKKCSCKKCSYKPKRCCKKICNSCRAQPQPAKIYQAPSSLVMIPYPVPFIVYPSKNSTQNQTTTTTKKPKIDKEAAKPDSSESPENVVWLRLPITRSTTYFLDTRYLQKQRMKLAKNYKCPYLAECSNNMDYSDYEYRRSKSNEKRRKLAILNSIRPTVGVRERSSRTTPMRELPRYGLVEIPPDMSEKLMSQLKNT